MYTVNIIGLFESDIISIPFLIKFKFKVHIFFIIRLIPNSQAARGSNVANPSKVFFSVDSTISECTFKDSS